MLRLLQQFRADGRGNTVMIFALCLLVMLLLIGGAIDMGMYYKDKQSAQDALDEAALNLAAIDPTDNNTALLVASKAFNNNISLKQNASVVSVAYDSNSRVYSVTARGTYQTFLMTLMGIQSMPYTVYSNTIRATSGTLEVALVLDNTWSMSVPLDGSQSKIQVLKTAAQALVSSVMTPANKDYVKVAIVPYADYVNVGMANRSQSWMSVAADYSTTSAQTCKTISTKSVCTGGTKGTCTGTQDGVPYSYSCWIVPQTCTTVPVTPYQSCSGGTTTYYKWYGCVKNQMSGKSLMLPDPTTPYVGIVQTSQTCLNPIVPLTNNSSTINSAINGLVVNIGGYKPETYIPAGLLWGVNVLSPPAPFTEGAAYDSNNKQPRKTIVLMTDGFNTLYSNTSGGIALGNSTQLATTYSDQQRVCNYAKSKNIEIYTIGFGVTDATGLSNLKSCATDASHYFDAQSSADLIAAFKTIGGKLTKVRITQ